MHAQPHAHAWPPHAFLLVPRCIAPRWDSLTRDIAYDEPVLTLSAMHPPFSPLPTYLSLPPPDG